MFRNTLSQRGVASGFLELGKASYSHYLFSDVWGLADTNVHFAKHFPLNFSTGLSWMEFNCFIGDSFALYRSECCFVKGI